MRFFVLERPETGTTQDCEAYTDAMATERAEYGNAPVCPACGGFVGMCKWLPPYRIELETWGRYYADIISPAGASDLIVSNRFVDIYRLQGLSGLYDIHPVEVARVIHRRQKPTEERPSYLAATVVRSQTMVDEEASGMQWAPSVDDDYQLNWGLGQLECAVCLSRKGQFVRQSGVVIKPDTWTGEDIFEPRGGGAKCVVSSKFKTACETNGIRGIRFIPAEQYEHDSFPSDAKVLLKHLSIFENPKYDRETRQDAYRTLYFAATDERISHDVDFDPDTEVDCAVIAAIKDRLACDGLLRDESL